MITLASVIKPQFPVFAECISPDIFGSKTLMEIAQLEAWEGNKPKKLGDLFKIEEVGQRQSEDLSIVINGDVGKFRRIGACMANGEINVNGNVGMHLGEEMRGGKITVKGDVGSWAGSMMKGGTIEIYGNVGDYLAAPYRGSSEGMRKGRIIVHGNVGNEAGSHMKTGLIKIYGNAGQFSGFRMRDGIIFVQGDSDERAGACMVGGKIVIGGFLESVLPTFTIEGLREKVKIEDDEAAKGPFYVFLGDVAEQGEGKLYVCKEKNPQLSHYERFL